MTQIIKKQRSTAILILCMLLSLAFPAHEVEAARGKRAAVSRPKAKAKAKSSAVTNKAGIQPHRNRVAPKLTVKERLGKLVRKVTRTPAKRTAEQVAGQLRPGTNIFVPIGHAVAKSVLKALSQRDGLSAKNPIRILGLTNTASRRLFESSKIVANSVFIGSNNRDAIAAGQGDFVPVHLSRVGGLITDGTLPVDVALILVSPPDKDGMVSLGPTAGATLEAISKAKRVIAEVNPNVPRTFGATQIHKSKIDFMVESDARISTVEPKPPSSVDVRIAKHVMKLIPSSPTLQFGIGTTTDAVAGLLAKSGRKDLKVHSEMISDGAMTLVQSGAVKGKVVYSFALGSQKMLNWMDGNKKLEAKPSAETNSIVKLAAIPKLVSINTALRIDLNGQVNAQYVGDRHYSGIGGQQDFFRGAMLSPGGKAILTIPSTSTITHDGNKKQVSRIVLNLGEGDLVTTGLHDLQYVVTEYGVAHLEGRNTTDRAQELIKIAHPKFRKELRKQLKEQLDKRKSAAKQRLAR